VGKKFDRLKEHVAREYADKGYGPERAEKIGEAVAGRIARLRGEAPDSEPAKEEKPNAG
jgi:hypothetical protein